MKILAVGAHPDDIEFGCFGTLSYYTSKKHEIFLVLFSSGEKLGKREIRENESKTSANLINAKIKFFRFPDTNINANSNNIDKFRDYVNKIKPDILFTHYPEDTHQDHRNTTSICLSSRNSFKRILFYEGPTSNNFSPNVFYVINEHFNKKIEGLKKHKSQQVRPYLNLEAISGLARYRAYQCGMFGTLCEAFYNYKWIEYE
jgi:LmbE family N-acetylglucosaminyl deacetylase